MIQVSRLTKQYKSIRAVDDISFSVAKAEVFAFLGPNGAGKTTTIKMLTTLLRPTSGQIKINGFDPKTDREKVRQSFGIVFQDPSLDEELTARENLYFHGVLYKVTAKILQKRMQQLLALVNLEEKQNQLVKTFSGGMKRRLEIARGLLHHPKIFFLDEPTLGLDPQTRHQIWEHILQLNKTEKITIFFTTHYIEEAEKYASQVAIIDGGKIITQATPAQLIEKTTSKTLEEAYLKLTGKTIREEETGALDHLRRRRQMMGGR